MAEPHERSLADATPAPTTDAPDREARRSAVLVHAADATRRRAWRAVLQPLGVRVLLSGREAEAAKCLADAALIFVVAVDAPAMRTTLAALRPQLPVFWLDATSASDDPALQTTMHAALDAAARAAAQR